MQSHTSEIKFEVGSCTVLRLCKDVKCPTVLCGPPYSWPPQVWPPRSLPHAPTAEPQIIHSQQSTTLPVK